MRFGLRWADHLPYRSGARSLAVSSAGPHAWAIFEPLRDFNFNSDWSNADSVFVNASFVYRGQRYSEEFYVPPEYVMGAGIQTIRSVALREAEAALQRLAARAPAGMLDADRTGFGEPLYDDAP